MQKGKIPFWKAALGGFVAGLTGGILMLMTAAFLRTYLGSPSATELIFDRAFPLVTVDFFVQQIGRFGGYIPLKIAGVVASLSGQLLTAAFGGLADAIILGGAQRRRADELRRWIDPPGSERVLDALFGVL